ncbi:hypothetical protein QYF50_07250 [Paenibacillus vini]|uniref:hypothetical protein n=1 Tax=Paenibacillus vini TaxID=1476024 RepID=UPI0025B70F8D|nr:hypothetical protein [Paenibacillus vini]MDN4067688.1 hypothetical protein [Paenibacillus vini]
MNQTEIMLGQLSAGELQNLACDLLHRLYQDWGVIHKSGGVEGTNKTRKGTPDAWCERDDGTLVYIQATSDRAKGKILGDLEKSIEELKKNNKNQEALCIAFLSFDPQSEEIEKCKKLANANGCEFRYYSNSEISKILEAKYPPLAAKYLKIQTDLKQQKKTFELKKDIGIPPQTAKKMNDRLWKHTSDELPYTLEHILKFFNTLKKMNKTSRQFFASIVDLSEPMRIEDHKMIVPAQELENALNIFPHEVQNQMNIIEKYKLGRIEHEEHPVNIIVWAADWPLLSDLKFYCEEEGINLKEIIVNLNFSLID